MSPGGSRKARGRLYTAELAGCQQTLRFLSVDCSPAIEDNRGMTSNQNPVHVRYNPRGAACTSGRVTSEGNRLRQYHGRAQGTPGGQQRRRVSAEEPRRWVHVVRQQTCSFSGPSESARLQPLTKHSLLFEREVGDVLCRGRDLNPRPLGYEGVSLSSPRAAGESSATARAASGRRPSNSSRECTDASRRGPTGQRPRSSSR